jgi:uncharacterized membrane protein YphA (DoxX/SURF4 family)
MRALARPLARRVVVRSAQIVVGVLLAWAALAKLGDIPALARDIHQFRLLPIAGENLLAMVLPWIELTAALSLLLGIRSRAGAVVAASLMAVFTTTVALALVRGLSIECGCFGTASAWRIGTAKLFENLAILAVAAVAILGPQRFGPDSRGTA